MIVPTIELSDRCPHTHMWYKAYSLSQFSSVIFHIVTPANTVLVYDLCSLLFQISWIWTLWM